MKSIHKKLVEAAALSVTVGISNIDIDSISVHEWGTAFRLKPEALARVFKENRIPISRVKFMETSPTELWVSFSFRGVRWSTYVTRDVEADFKATLEAKSVKLIESKPTRPSKQLCLPAPV